MLIFPFFPPTVFLAQKCQPLIFSKVQEDISDKTTVQEGKRERIKPEHEKERSQEGESTWVSISIYSPATSEYCDLQSPLKAYLCQEKNPFIKPSALIQGCHTVQYTCAVLFTYLESHCAVVVPAAQPKPPHRHASMSSCCKISSCTATKGASQRERTCVSRGPAKSAQWHLSPLFLSRELSTLNLQRGIWFALIF